MIVEVDDLHYKLTREKWRIFQSHQIRISRSRAIVCNCKTIFGHYIATIELQFFV